MRIRKTLKIGFLLIILMLLDLTRARTSDDQLPRVYYNQNHYLEPLNLRLSNHLSNFNYSAYIDRSVKRFMNRWELNGVSMAVVKDERLVFARGYGFADVENKIEVDPGHLFRIASASKLITGIAVMKLVEEGKLSLSDKVFGKEGILNKYKLKARDRRLNDITVEHLLRHTGGWTQRYGDPAFYSLDIARKTNQPAPATIRSYIDFIASRRLHFTPGTRRSYSNMGYMLLGEVIAQSSGMSYEEYVKMAILHPLGINDMHIGRSLSSEKRFNEVRYYEQEGSLPIRSCYGTGEIVPKSDGGNNIELLGAAGGWIASPAEMARLVVAVNGTSKRKKDILQPESIQKMTKSIRGFAPFGWKGTLSNGTWWRTGSMAGTSTMIMKYPDGTIWVFLVNTSSWKGSMFPSEIKKLMARILRRVKDRWPDHDLFEFYSPKEILAAY